MISPELIRRYKFFWCMDDGQQKAVAMISDEVAYAEGAVIHREDEPANALFLLLQGNVTLSVDMGGVSGNLIVGEISPGEPFGICALLAGQTHTSTARATVPSRAIKIDAAELRDLCTVDCKLGYCLMQQVAKAALDQLHTTHIQLAAAQA
jgi:CRP-like cAMP-binding protein